MKNRLLLFSKVTVIDWNKVNKRYIRNDFCTVKFDTLLKLSPCWKFELELYYILHGCLWYLQYIHSDSPDILWHKDISCDICMLWVRTNFSSILIALCRSRFNFLLLFFNFHKVLPNKGTFIFSPKLFKVLQIFS